MFDADTTDEVETDASLDAATGEAESIRLGKRLRDLRRTDNFTVRGGKHDSIHLKRKKGLTDDHIESRYRPQQMTRLNVSNKTPLEIYRDMFMSL